MEKLFGISKRSEEDEIRQDYCNLALAIQMVTEEIVLKMAKEASEITSSKNLCLAGGVALNCVANGKVLAENIFENIFIQPASGDSGGALGAALAAHHIYHANKKEVVTSQHSSTYLGPSFSPKEIKQVSKKAKAVYLEYTNFDDLCHFVAQQLAEVRSLDGFRTEWNLAQEHWVIGVFWVIHEMLKCKRK